MFYSIFFLRKIRAMIIDKSNEANIINIKLAGEEPISPNGTFIPINDATIVGIEQTIVMLAKNFITSFKLFEIIVA